MSSFYGNMKNNSRSSFIIDKIYPSRAAMEKALKNIDTTNQNKITGDGIFINRYVMVNYSYTLNDTIDSVLENQDSTDLLYQAVDKAYVNVQNCGNYFMLVTNEQTGVKTYQKVTSKTYSTDIPVFYQYRSYIDRFIPKASLFQNEAGLDELIASGDGGPVEHPLYHKHKMDDYNQYHAVYDRTVWMKIYIDNQEQYIMVAQLDSKAPRFEMIPDAPGGDHRAPYFDLYQSNDFYYQYHIPKEWNLVLNEYNPNPEEGTELTKEDKEYYYYERDFEKEDPSQNLPKTFNDKIEYPYYNKAGFDPIFQHNTHNDATMDSDDYIRFVEVNSGETYPAHVMRHIRLTSDTYYPNHYYTPTAAAKIDVDSNQSYDINKAYYKGNSEPYTYVPLVLQADGSYAPLNGENVTKCDNIDDVTLFKKCVENAGFNPNAVYYELTWRTELKTDEQGNIVTDEKGNTQTIRKDTIQKDTKRLDIYLPSLGDTISDFYDVLYGRPRFVNGDWNLIGYCSKEKWWNDFGSDDRPSFEESGEGTVECWSTGKRKVIGLTDDEINQLSPEIYPGVYDVPIYSYGFRRPYNNYKVIDQLVAPYNNVGGREDDLSVGWGLGILKKYISELRYLATGTKDLDKNGDLIRNGPGLQSDWILDDSSAFGYIYNKPAIIKTFMPTKFKSIADIQQAMSPEVQEAIIAAMHVGLKFYKRRIITNPTAEEKELNYLPGDIVFDELDQESIADPLLELKDIYELPATAGEENIRKQYTYEQISDDAEFEEDTEYYIRNGSAYSLATNRTPYYIINDIDRVVYKPVFIQEEYFTPNTFYIKNGSNYIFAEEYNANANYYRAINLETEASDINALVSYTVTVDDNNNITSRKMLFNSGSKDSIYLVNMDYSKVLETFIVNVNTINDNQIEQLVDSLLETIPYPVGSQTAHDYSTNIVISRQDILDFLNNYCTLVLDDEAIETNYYFESVDPDLLVNSLGEGTGFVYKEIYYRELQSKLDINGFDALKTNLYVYVETDSFDPSYYEIHRIWQRAGTFTG